MKISILRRLRCRRRPHRNLVYETGSLAPVQSSPVPVLMYGSLRVRNRNECLPSRGMQIDLTRCIEISRVHRQAQTEPEMQTVVLNVTEQNAEGCRLIGCSLYHIVIRPPEGRPWISAAVLLYRTSLILQVTTERQKFSLLNFLTTFLVVILSSPIIKFTVLPL